MSVTYNRDARDAEHSQRPNNSSRGWGELDADDPSKSRGWLLAQGCVIGRLGRTRSQSRSCRRAVRQRGGIERCMRSTVTGRWFYCSLRRSKPLAALEEDGHTGLMMLFSTCWPVV